MSFLIDTDICSAHLRGKGSVTNRLLQYTGGLHVSMITVGELYTWHFGLTPPPRRLVALQEMFGEMNLLPVTHEVARKHGELRATLFDRGLPAPDMDLIIAATALVHELSLVTHNTNDFMNVPGLRLIDWLA